MKFLPTIALGAFLAHAAIAYSQELSTVRPVADSLSANPRLEWFNSLDRSFSLDVGAGPIQVTLHSPNGRLLTLVHQGSLGEHQILRVSDDLPPGVYLLRVRQAGKQSLDRVTVF